jgi:tRNA pseudouridine32 synthase/23S rRNA pseudouridine746 synthase/23S rRNA pseudouridine1911/1915/1917 synthase
MITTKNRQNRHLPKGLFVLYEDKEVIVINKPVGLLVVGTERDKLRTVHFILNEYVRKGNSKSRNRIYIVHRLDRDTSGILVFAKSEQAQKHLQDHWTETEKIYLAIVHGRISPQEGQISSYLTENSALNVYSTPDPLKGKLSHTVYRTLKEAKGLSLLEITLLTGRKHQIRVHLAEKGHPVAGDKKYGKKGDGQKCMALHAQSIVFTHPVTGKLLSFATEVPERFVRLIGNYSPVSRVADEPGQEAGGEDHDSLETPR